MRGTLPWSHTAGGGNLPPRDRRLARSAGSEAALNEGPSILSGTWHSVYEYESSSWGQALTGERDVKLHLSGFPRAVVSVGCRLLASPDIGFRSPVTGRAPRVFSS